MILVIGLLLAYFGDQIIRVRALLTLFEAEGIVENFRTMDAVFETSIVLAAPPSHELGRVPSDLPETRLQVVGFHQGGCL